MASFICFLLFKLLPILVFGRVIVNKGMRALSPKLAGPKNSGRVIRMNTNHHGHMAPSTRQNYLVCFYCNQKSCTKYDGLITQWECLLCESMNYLDENGEATDPPVATDEAAVVADLKYSINRPESPPALQPYPASSDSVFCSTCIQNQHLYRSCLAQYDVETDPTHPDYRRLEREFFKYKKQVEQMYPQVCEDCEPKVLERMRKAKYGAQADHARILLQKSRERRAALAQITTFYGSVNLIGKCLWYSGVLAQLLWHITALANVVQHTYPVFVDSYIPDVALTLSSWLSKCIVSFLAWSLWCSAIGGFWNPKFREVMVGFMGHITGYPEWYKHQAILFVVRILYYNVMGTGVLADPFAPPTITAHIFGFGFITYLAIVSNHSVKVDMTPIWESTPEKIKFVGPGKRGRSSTPTGTGISMYDALNQIASAPPQGPRSKTPPTPPSNHSRPQNAANTYDTGILGLYNTSTRNTNTRKPYGAPATDGSINPYQSGQQTATTNTYNSFGDEIKSAYQTRQQTTASNISNRFHGGYVPPYSTPQQSAFSDDGFDISLQSSKAIQELLGRPSYNPTGPNNLSVSDSSMNRNIQNFQGGSNYSPMGFKGLSLADSPRYTNLYSEKEDQDMMDTSPVQPQSKHRAFSPVQRDTQLFGQAPVASEPSPFWFKVPAAPITPAQRLRNPPNQPRLRVSSQETKENFFKNVTSPAPFARSDKNGITTGGKRAKQEMILAQQRLFAESSQSEVGEDLADIFSSFTLSSEPLETRERFEQAAKSNKITHFWQALVLLIGLVFWNQVLQHPSAKTENIPVAIMLACLLIGARTLLDNTVWAAKDKQPGLAEAMGAVVGGFELAGAGYGALELLAGRGDCVECASLGTILVGGMMIYEIWRASFG